MRSIAEFARRGRPFGQGTGGGRRRTGEHERLGRPGTTGPAVGCVRHGHLRCALGDSFSSGDGDKAKGWVDQTGTANTGDSDDHCNRSSQAYPEVADKWMAKQSYLPAMSFAFLACSGATTTDVYSGSPSYGDGLAGATGDHGEGEQISYPQLSSARIVTMTTGGDDISFPAVMQDCVLATPVTPCDSSSPISAVADASQNISNLYDSLVSTYNTVVGETPYGAQVYVIGYPDLFPSSPTSACQSLGIPAMAYLASLESQLNSEIAQAAAATGVTYVDPNSGANSFVGHDICTSGSTAWFNGLNLVGALGWGAPFHPNKRGQAAMAASLETAIAAQNKPIKAGPKNHVLVFGNGDVNEDPTYSSFTNIAAALEGIGDTVTTLPGQTSLPSIITGYGQIWVDTITNLSAADEHTLEAFIQGGGRVFLTGEWGPVSQFENQTVQDVLDDVLPSPPQVEDAAMTGSSTVNPTVLDGLASKPNALTTWTPSYNGELSGVAPSNVLFTDGDSGTSGAAWQVGSKGRLVVLMDINWAEDPYKDPATMPPVTQNIGYFLGH